MKIPTTKSEQRAYVEHILEVTGWDKPTLAKKSKIGENTIYNLLNGASRLKDTYYHKIQYAVKKELRNKRKRVEKFALIYKGGKWYHVTVKKPIQSTTKGLE